MNWVLPSNEIYTFYLKLMEQPSVLIGGGAECGKTTNLRNFLFSACRRPPMDVRNAVRFIIIDESIVGLSEFESLPHTLKYITRPEDVPGALQYALNEAEERLEAAAERGLKEWDLSGELYVVIDNLHWLILKNKTLYTNLLLQICLLARQSHVHVVAAAKLDMGRKIIPTELMNCIPGRVALRCDSVNQSKQIIGMAGAESLKIGDCYFQGQGEDLTHCMNIPFVDDERIAERVKWWTDQMPKKAQKDKQGFFSRLFSTTTLSNVEKSLASMSGYDFERYAAGKLREAGYSNINVTSKSGDYGADIIARTSGGKKVCFQCKKYEKPVGVSAVQEVAAARAYYRCDVAAVISVSGYTEQARRLAATSGVVLMDAYRIRKI